MEHSNAFYVSRLLVALFTISAIAVASVLGVILNNRSSFNCNAINDNRKAGISRALLLTRMIIQEDKPGTQDDVEILSMKKLISEGVLPQLKC